MKALNKTLGEQEDHLRAYELMDLQQEDHHPTGSHEQLQHNQSKIPKDTFHRNRELNPKVHVEVEKIQDDHSNLEQKEQCWRLNYHVGFQAALQIYSNKNSMVLKQNRQKNGTKEKT